MPFCKHDVDFEKRYKSEITKRYGMKRARRLRQFLALFILNPKHHGVVYLFDNQFVANLDDILRVYC